MLLDGTSMPVLVASERSSTRKRLLAVGVGALVRALSGVNAPVASERTAVAETLPRVSLERGTSFGIGNVPWHKSRSDGASRQYAHADARSRQIVG